MAEFRRAVLTQKGFALLAKAQSDGIPIVVTKAAVGSGEYTDEEDLTSRTALKEPKQDFALSSITRQNEVTVFIHFSITNKLPSGELEHGYNVREIGIIANDPDEGEILYALAVAGEGQSDYLPAYGGSLPTVIGVNFAIEVANADTVIIHTDVSAYVTTEELEAKGIYWYGEEEKETVFKPDGSIEETTARGKTTTVFNADGSITESYPDGRVLVTIFNADGSVSRRLALAGREEDDA